MLHLNDTFGAFYGSGYLTVGDRWRPMVGYKLVLRREDFSGGGVLVGLNDEDVTKASELGNVFLSISQEQFLVLVVGPYDGDGLATAVNGVRRHPF